MKQRCLNPNRERFKRYGGRGIDIYPEWAESFEAFLRDVGPCPGRGCTLGRKDNDVGYVPGNVQWETKIQQANNKSNSVKVTFNGVTRTVAEWARLTGKRPTTLYTRVATGLSPEEILK
jgi:hypothetical protein